MIEVLHRALMFGLQNASLESCLRIFLMIIIERTMISHFTMRN